MSPQKALSQALGDGANEAKGLKRGRKQSARRAANYQRAQLRSRGIQVGVSERRGGVFGRKNSVDKKGNKLNFEETYNLLARRKQPYEELRQEEYEDLLELDGKTNETAEAATKFDADYRQSVGNTKVPLYGNLHIDEKHDDALRLLSININVLTMWMKNNFKAERLKYILQQYNIDILGLQEVCINWAAFKASHTIASLLRYGPTPMRSVASYNKRESRKTTGRVQRGGTATILNDGICAYAKNRGTDHTGLGRWSWYLLEGDNGCKTRVITAYAPCGNASGDAFTVYQQHERYIKSKGLKTNPKTMFRDDLLAQLRQWRKDKENVILMMDANENVIDGVMCRKLGDKDIDMVESVHDQVGGPGPNTWFRGKESIDGIWVTRNMEIIGASYLPFHADLGDHRPVLLDITMKSAIGEKLLRVVPVKARKLNSKVLRVRKIYNDRLEALFLRNNVYGRLREVEEMLNKTETDDFPVDETISMELERIDRLVTNLMQQAEKGCRKLRANHYEYSPQVKLWLDRCHAYRQLIRYHCGKRIHNIGNMKRFAKRCGIPQPLKLSKAQVITDYKECKSHLRRLLGESPWLRKQYLSSKLDQAKESQNEENAARLREMMRAEAQKKEWSHIHRVTKPNRNASATVVQVPQAAGPAVTVDTKEEVEAAVAEENSKRFGLAGSAPICHGALRELLGFSANTETAEQILRGEWSPPPDTDPATVILLDEIGRIWKKMEGGEVDIVVSQEDFQYYWKRVKERTSSSFSGLHFGHYKAASYSDFLSRTHALKLSLISRTGSAPDRWARGLNVMLEKVAGIALVTKLRAILLMEADFNYHNKLIFGQRMMDLARQHGMVPEEIYNEKGRTSEDALLQQILVYDIARQLRRPLIVASVDASQCYDRVAHAMASLTLRAYKVQMSSVFGMLSPIQCMEYYLRTGHGESSTYFGGKEDPKQGLCQGNGAAPPTWQQISSLMINVQRRHRHGITIRSPISKREIQQVGIIYVDDTNLWAGLEDNDDLLSTAYKAQEGVNQWGQSLVATGGDLNPIKCSWTVHDYVPDGKGGWTYPDDDQTTKKSDEGLEDLEFLDDNTEEVNITVPTNNSDAEAIKRLKSSEAVEYLGLFSRPDGKSEHHFEQMTTRVEEWTTNVRQGHLPTRSVWASYTHQLWAGLRYGLSATTAGLLDLSEGLGASDYYLLSSLGVARSITKPWRYLPSHLGGMGLFNLSTEATAAAINTLLQHYGTQSPLGHTITTSLEHLQLELGVTGCPLFYDYSKWSVLATESWVKSLWEKVNGLKLDLYLDYPSLPAPRERDKCIMEELVTRGWTGNDLQAVNRCRKHQEAIYFSCISTASGGQFDRTYLTDWCLSAEFEYGRHRSHLTFGKEYPLESDWETWKAALADLSSSNLRHHTSLGRWCNEPICIWRTFVNDDDGTVEVLTDDGLYLYSRDGSGPRQYSSPVRAPYSMPRGVPFTARINDDSTNDTIRIGVRSEDAWGSADIDDPMSFEEHLHKMGGSWMWDNLQLTDDVEWLVDALKTGTLIGVTDGSYNGKVKKDICGAGWVLFCTTTGKWVAGAFAERSSSASSYRGELLGMLAIHLFLLALEEYHGIHGEGNNIFCDNKGAIFTFSKNKSRVSAGAKNGDIQRVLRRVNTRLHNRPSKQHVKAHQDDRANRRDLSLPAQLNCFCDDLAKKAVMAAILEPSFTTGRLPLECASITIDGHKQTTDVAKGLRQQFGHRGARNFFEEEGLMTPQVFDSVAWDDIRRTLAGKPRMYQLWYGKQVSGYCGTGEMIHRYDNTVDHRCPNCGMDMEDAAHLNVCGSPERRQLLSKHIEEIEDWLKTHHTHPELRVLLPVYLAHRGHQSFDTLQATYSMSQEMKAAGHEQDCIGWRNFTEGRIGCQFREMQDMYLRSSPTRMTIDTWMKTFIDLLLQLTHSQWIFRNITKHHHTKGTLVRACQDEVIQEIEKQLDLGIGKLPEESRFLLEIPPAELYGYRIAKQQYWLYAIKAARLACENALRATAGQSTSWQDVCNDPTRTDIPYFNPPPPPEAPKPPESLPQPSPVEQLKSSKELSAEHMALASEARAKVAEYRNSDEVASSAVPSDTVEFDHLNILADIPIPERDWPTFNHLLNQHCPARIEGSRDNAVIINHGQERLHHGSFARLREGVWLSDESINYFLKNIVQHSHEGTHCYGSYFFKQLLEVGEGGYNFAQVRRWHNRIQGGLFDLDSLFIPINRDESHWLLLHVQPTHRRIRLYDSLPAGGSNDHYIPSMLRYLFDVAQLTGQTSEAFPTWVRQWDVLDTGGASPRQTNTYDCGLFTIINAALLANGCPLDANTYRQTDLYALGTRQRIAYMLYDHGRVLQLPTTRFTQPGDTSSATSGGPEPPAPTSNPAVAPFFRRRQRRRRVHKKSQPPPKAIARQLLTPSRRPRTSSTNSSSVIPTPATITPSKPTSASTRQRAQHKKHRRQKAQKANAKPTKHSRANYTSKQPHASTSRHPKRSRRSLAEAKSRRLGLPYEYLPLPKRKRKHDEEGSGNPSKVARRDRDTPCTSVMAAVSAGF